MLSSPSLPSFLHPSLPFLSLSLSLYVSPTALWESIARVPEATNEAAHWGMSRQSLPSFLHPSLSLSVSVVCCLLSVVCCLLSVVCCLLSVVCCLLSVAVGALRSCADMGLDISTHNTKTNDCSRGTDVIRLGSVPARIFTGSCFSEPFTTYPLASRLRDMRVAIPNLVPRTLCGA